jgi:uncharacterized membrane protein YGL010W
MIHLIFVPWIIVGFFGVFQNVKSTNIIKINL